MVGLVDVACTAPNHLLQFVILLSMGFLARNINPELQNCTCLDNKYINKRNQHSLDQRG